MWNLITRNRAALMALAILGVLLTHTNNNYGCFALNRLIVMGYGGVDVFFFLSGFGLYFSYSKKPQPLAFYRKRLLRIYPAFLAVLAIYLTQKHLWSWPFFLEMASTVGFWLPIRFHCTYLAWFVSAILLLYALTPLYWQAFRRWPAASTLATFALSGILCALFVWTFTVLYPGYFHGYMLFIARIPVFYLGFFAGYCHAHDLPHTRPARRWTAAVMALAFVVGFAALQYGLNHYSWKELRLCGMLFYPYLLMTPGFCVGMGWMVSKLPQAIGRTLGWLGGFTLEAYLLISVIYTYKAQFGRLAGGNPSLGCLLMVLATLTAAWLLHHVVGFGMAWLSQGTKRLARRCRHDRE